MQIYAKIVYILFRVFDKKLFPFRFLMISVKLFYQIWSEVSSVLYVGE